MSLTIDQAWSALAAMRTACEQRNSAAVLAVVDSHGEAIALARMDGAPLTSIQAALNKAYTAARERKPSQQLGRAARDPVNGFDLAGFGDPRITGWGGGLPIWIDRTCLGAIGVSGLAEQQDIEIASVGLAACGGESPPRTA